MDIRIRVPPNFAGVPRVYPTTMSEPLYESLWSRYSAEYTESQVGLLEINGKFDIYYCGTFSVDAVLSQNNCGKKLAGVDIVSHPP